MSQPRLLRIAIDAMGGDLGPEEVVRGVVRAARLRDDSALFIIVGDEATIAAELERQKPVPTNICVRHASQTIGMEDRPREAYRRKPDASVVVSARLVGQGEADAFISIGNTGAAMAAALFLMRRIHGIDRPAIATPIPSLAGQVVLVDAGANVDCSAHQLLQFAIMGQCYARLVLGAKDPKVGLLSNGEEASKGNELTKAAHQLLKQHISFFVGNVEGRDVFRGVANVIACD